MHAARNIFTDRLFSTLRATAQAAESIAPVCPLCHSAASSHAFLDAGCELRVCNNCELFFVHPYPRVLEQHRRVTSGEYPGIELLDSARRYQGERLYYDRHFDLIAQETRDAKSILDVGCGTGNLLERFASRSNCYRLGIELNPVAAQLARSTAKCEILELPFESFRTARKFDAITMVSVFSHVSSFDGMFGSLHNALAPGGRVIMRTTEMALHVSRWNQVHWGIPDDLHFLGLNTLSYLCKQYGFSVTRHVRVPFEQELFQPSRWKQVGRNRWHNALKRTAVRVPGALAGMQKLYAATLGQRLFVSLIVLKTSSGENSTGHAQPAAALHEKERC